MPVEPEGSNCLPRRRAGTFRKKNTHDTPWRYCRGAGSNQPFGKIVICTRWQSARSRKDAALRRRLLTTCASQRATPRSLRGGAG
jgi:hypothetical protein